MCVWVKKWCPHALPSPPTPLRGRVGGAGGVCWSNTSLERQIVADALSRWVFPGESQQDVSVHGSAADAEFLNKADALLNSVVVAPVSLSSAAVSSVPPAFLDILFKDWSVKRQNCSRWGKDFVEIVEHGKILPHFHWNGRRLFLNDRICVPLSFFLSCSTFSRTWAFRCRQNVFGRSSKV